MMSLPPALQVGWADSLASLPPTEGVSGATSPALMSFLGAAAVAAAADWAGLPSAATKQCQALAAQLQHPAARYKLALAWHLRVRLFGVDASSGAGNPQASRDAAAALSTDELALEGFDDTATLCLLLLLSGVPQLLSQHRCRGVPEHVSRASLGDIAVWVRAHRTGGVSPLQTRRAGVDDHDGPSWGIRNVSWPMNTLRGELIRVGRLQHREATYDAPFTLYQQLAPPHRRQLVREHPPTQTSLRMLVPGVVSSADITTTIIAVICACTPRCAPSLAWRSTQRACGTRRVTARRQLSSPC
jgi:hypothetical protein